MYDKSNFRAEYFPFPIVSASLKAMSPEEFAALGAETIVFVRPITGTELAHFIPEAQIAPEDAVFQLIMSADGSPVLVTDNDAAITDWLEDRDEITLVRRH